MTRPAEAQAIRLGRRDQSTAHAQPGLFGRTAELRLAVLDPERSKRLISGGVSVGLGDLDAKSLRGVSQASVVAVQVPEILAQAHDGCQVQGVERA